MNYTKTRAEQVAIGERRKPQPEGRSGYLRVDTVQQGDQDGIKGVYHINAVDEVTQWQVIGSVAAITQTHLESVLGAILAQFPFVIRCFHSDDGSEFINDLVSGLLKRLMIQQTKSGPAGATTMAWSNQERGRDPQAHGLWIHRRRARQRHPPVLPRSLQSLPELPSAVWPARAHCRGGRQGVIRIPELHDTVGTFARTGERRARSAGVSPTGIQSAGPGPNGKNPQRHRVRQVQARGRA